MAEKELRDMEEGDKQEIFREETRRRLDVIESKIEHLDQIVVQGNGREALTVQVARLETKMAEIDGKMTKLDKIDRIVTELNTNIALLKENTDKVPDLQVSIEAMKASSNAAQKTKWSALQIVGFVVSLLSASIIGPLIVHVLTKAH